MCCLLIVHFGFIIVVAKVYIACCVLAFCFFINSLIPNSGLDKTSFFICFKYFFAPSIEA